MEMAQAHRRLGSEVTVIEGAKALGKDDPELDAIVLEAAPRRRRQRSSRARRSRASARTTAARSSVRERDGRERSQARHLLIAVGRKANVERLGSGRPRASKTTKARHQGRCRPAHAPTGASMPSATWRAGCSSPMSPTTMPGIVIRSCLFRLPAKVRTARHALGHLHRSGARPGRPDRARTRGEAREQARRSCGSNTPRTTARGRASPLVSSRSWSRAVAPWAPPSWARRRAS